MFTVFHRGTRDLGHAAALVVASVILTPALWAQFNSQIEGTVTDPSQALVPGATLTLTNAGTGIKMTAQTSSAGYFRFPALPPAAFTLTAVAPGFKTTTISDLRLEIGQTRTVNISLEVGAAATSVNVEATASTVELSEARVSSVVEARQLTDLLGRNFLSLVALTAGVTGSYNFNDTFGSETQVNMNAAGPCSRPSPQAVELRLPNRAQGSLA